MITFQVEGWARYYTDPTRERLWWEHYLELEPAHDGQMLMGPDVEFYEALDRAGRLVVVVGRVAGVMVGYCLVVVKRHPHYATVCGFEDSYFLTKSERKGSAGLRLIRAGLAELERRGVRRSYWMTKEFLSMARLFQHLGMVKMDEVWVSSSWKKE